MDGNALDVQSGKRRGAGIGLDGFGDGDAEFVLGRAGRDLRVTAGTDVRVYPKRHRRRYAHGRRHSREHLGFGKRFQVELVKPTLEREPHLLLGFADSREDDLVRRYARRARPAVLPARDHVRSEPQIGECRDDGAIGISLYGISDQRVGQAVQPLAQRGHVAAHRRRRVDVDGRADIGRDLRERHILAMKLAINELEMIHPRPNAQVPSPLQVAKAWRVAWRRPVSSLKKPSASANSPVTGGTQTGPRRCCTSSTPCGSNIFAIRSTSIGKWTNARARPWWERRRSTSAAVPGCSPNRSRASELRSPVSMPRPS